MTVVTFVARNIAQLGLHVFERVGETDRRRDRKSALARAFVRPDSQMTGYDLVFATVGDLMLYDRAYWVRLTDDSGGVVLRRLPPVWVSAGSASLFEVGSYKVAVGDRLVDIPASEVLAFPGYSPTDPLKGSPAVEALRATLQEQIDAAVYRGQVWRRGGRVSAVIERPREAPEWSKEAREAFREDWYAKYTGRGTHAGGTPILEDGMKLTRVDFNAQEQQYVEAAKLSLTTVAAAYHVNPTMIGQNDGANYSNVREFRKMLYGDTLGPTIARIEARINAFLVAMVGMDPDTFYAEFNIAEKLQGNFEEQTTALQSAVGGPWMTRNEARARQNLPSVDGGDELIVPLNVLTGGQASPIDSAPKARLAGGVRLKARASAKAAAEDRPNDAERMAELLKAFFGRQRKAVLSALGAGSKDAGDPGWWDSKRWDKELAADLLAEALTVTEAVGTSVAGDLGGEYDVPRTQKFLEAVAASRASMINTATRDQLVAKSAEIDDWDEDSEDPEPQLADVFDEAEEKRSLVGAATLVTTLVAFATTEAAEQVAPNEATKTWVVTSANPRPEHAAMDGETVPVGEKFSNGASWPGDPVLGVDGVAGCTCDLVVQRG